MIYQGTADSALIYGYFERVLPKLKNSSVVIVDNATFHKSPKQYTVFWSFYPHIRLI